LVDDVRIALEARLWYAALGLGLALPDIASYIETPTPGIGERYARWFMEYVVKRQPMYDDGENILVSGWDCYALRCAFLHQGDADVRGPEQLQARDVVEHFTLLAPGLNGYTPPMVSVRLLPRPGVEPEQRRGRRPPRPSRPGSVTLAVNTFCEHICLAVEAWLVAKAGDSEVMRRVGSLPLVRTPESPESPPLRQPHEIQFTWQRAEDSTEE